MVVLSFLNWVPQYVHLPRTIAVDTNDVIVEILGWVARIWSSKCPYAQTPYLMQITTLIIGK